MDKPIILIADESGSMLHHLENVEVKDVVLVDEPRRRDGSYLDVAMAMIMDIGSMVHSCIIDMSNPVPKQYLHEPNPRNHGKRFEASRQNSNRNNHWNNHRLQQRTRSVCGNRASSTRFQQAKKGMARH